MEKLQAELTERCGSEPTFSQWAAAAGVDQKTLRRRINYGSLCKDKMIKSNIRLVISIAKNYQGAGMNLQDLVQVCSVDNHCQTENGRFVILIPLNLIGRKDAEAW